MASAKSVLRYSGLSRYDKFMLQSQILYARAGYSGYNCAGKSDGSKHGS